MARILVVDDQVQILKVVETILTARGHIVTTAPDSFAAIEKLQAQPFELVISDVVMPAGASGYDLVKTMRKLPNHDKTPIMLLTGRREKKDVERGMEAGVDDYMVKPLDPDLFIAKIDMLLSKQKNAADFTECGVAEAAQYHGTLRVVGLSEVGLTFTSPQPFAISTKISLDCSLFVTIGIESPVLRVIGCEPRDEGFSVRVVYVGMTEKSLQPLRLWIRSKKLSHAS